MLESDPNEKSGAMDDLQNEINGEIDGEQNQAEEGKDVTEQGAE